MTEQELKKLNRGELLLLIQRLEREKQQLQDRIIYMERQQRERGFNLKKFGSLAEASLQVSGVFEAAQKAADQYLKHAAEMDAACRYQKMEADRILAEAQQKVRTLEEQTQQQCQQMLEKAKTQASDYWKTFEEEMYQQLENYVPAWHAEHSGMGRPILDMIEETEEAEVLAEEVQSAEPEESQAAPEAPEEDQIPEEETEEITQEEPAAVEDAEATPEEALPAEEAEEVSAQIPEEAPAAQEALPEDIPEEAADAESSQWEEGSLSEEEQTQLQLQEEALLAQIIAEFAPVTEIPADTNWEELLRSDTLPSQMLPLELDQ